MNRCLKPIAYLVVVLLLAVMAPAVFIAPAEAAPASMTGTVTGGGNPLNMAAVQAFLLDGTAAGDGNPVMTNPDGTYEIPNLDDGTQYKVVFMPYVNFGFAFEYYSNSPNWSGATAVYPQAGLNADLGTGDSTVTGRVTDSETGLGIEMGTCYVFDPNISTYIIYSLATMLGDGYYSLPCYAGETYFLYFGDMGSQHDAVFYQDGTPTPVAAGSTNINQALPPSGGGGSITGTVYDSLSNPVEYVGVYIYDPNTYELVSSTQSQSNGTYEIPTLTEGNSYKVVFDPSYANFAHSTSLAPEWYSDAASWNFASTATVPQSGVDAYLDDGLATTGTIKNGSNEGISGASVDIYDADATIEILAWQQLQTQGDGTYSVPLKSGASNKIKASHWQYTDKWYNDVLTWGDATPASAGSSGIDITLGNAPSMSGTVTDGVNPLEGVTVTLYNPMGWQVGTDSTDINGEWEVIGLNGAETYKVLFSRAQYVPEWHNDKGTFATADGISPQTGLVTALSDSDSTISGTVTGSDTQAGIGAIVNVYDPTMNIYMGTATASTGTYSAEVKSGYQYKIKMYSLANGYASQWYDNKPDWDTGDLVASGASGIDQELTRNPGTVQGTVTDGVNPVANVLVKAYNDSGTYTGHSDYTEIDGTYEITGLYESQNYRILFDTWDQSLSYAYEWYNNVGLFYDSTNVIDNYWQQAVADATLDAPATITGTVTDGTDPVVGGTIGAYDATFVTSQFLFDEVLTQAGGVYTVNNLRSGVNYKLKFNKTGCVSEWYQDQTSWTNANAVAGGSSNVDFVIESGPTSPPTIDSLTDVDGYSTTTVPTGIYGTNFEEGMTVQLEKDGQTTIDATDVIVSDPTFLNCQLPLTNAVDGLWDVRVTTSGGTDVLEDGFTVLYHAPEITAIVPDSGANNGSVHISNLSGQYFRTGVAVKLTKAGQTDINATNVIAVSSTQITCDLDLTNKLAGNWNVVVTNDDDASDTLTNGFEVQAPPIDLTSITPNAYPRNHVVHISNLAGSNFQEGVVVSLIRFNQNPISATNITVHSSSRISCDFDLTGKVLGNWSVYAVNPNNGSSDTLSNAFQILTDEEPTGGDNQVLQGNIGASINIIAPEDFDWSERLARPTGLEVPDLSGSTNRYTAEDSYTWVRVKSTVTYDVKVKADTGGNKSEPNLWEAIGDMYPEIQPPDSHTFGGYVAGGHFLQYRMRIWTGSESPMEVSGSDQTIPGYVDKPPSENDWAITYVRYDQRTDFGDTRLVAPSRMYRAVLTYTAVESTY